MTTEAPPRRIPPREFYQALVEAGVVRDDDSVIRVVIDVSDRNPAVVLYVERWGDERLLDVVTTLDGVEIRGVPKEPKR